MTEETAPTPPRNVQAGVDVGDGISDSGLRVAHGDRRYEVRMVPDPGQLVRADHLEPPGTLPPQMAGSAPEGPAATALQAVAVMPESPSVWDARPPGEVDGD